MNPTTSTISKKGRTSSLILAMILMFTGFFALVAVPSAFAGHQDAPEIASIDPESGPVGTYVTVEGDGFSEEDEVRFGGISVDHDFYGEDKIGFYVPEVAPSDYNIEVENDVEAVAFCCFNVSENETEPTASSEPEPDPQAKEPSSKEVSNDKSCNESGMNVQCNDFGTIKMVSQQEIRGEPVQNEIVIELNDNYADQGARQIMFSIRNVTTFMGDSPVVLSLDSITANGEEIYTSRIDQNSESEINIWVDVLDTPVGTPITIVMDVGVTDRGLFHLETLAMPFDRGYDTVRDSDGEAISLYSFTVLGVNEATDGLDAGSPISKLTPAPGVALLVAAIGLAAVVVRGRKSA